MIPRRRQQAGLEPGRHAAPVDQADAILWAEDLRLRALTLISQQDTWLEQRRELGWSISADSAARWMADAYCVLREVSRGA